MNDREKSLASLLRCAAILSDWAAQDVVAVSLEPRRQNLRDIVEAIAGLYQVRDRLYQKRPALKPDQPAGETDADSPVAAYGLDNPMPPELQHYFTLRTAVEMLEGLANGHNTVLAEIARGALPELESELARLSAADD